MVKVNDNQLAPGITSTVDTAVNQSLTLDMARQVLASPLTWLPSIAYLSESLALSNFCGPEVDCELGTATFGYELAMDANLSNVLYNLYRSPSFGQTKAGYVRLCSGASKSWFFTLIPCFCAQVASIYGLMNVYSRACGETSRAQSTQSFIHLTTRQNVGGYMGDVIYTRFGVPGKKYLTLVLGTLQGFMSLALGLYIDSRDRPSRKFLISVEFLARIAHDVRTVAVVIVVFVILAIVNQAGNGANFSLVPHCNPSMTVHFHNFL